ncbi:MAG: VTT domain-containing protein [Betaproteobacteria bacterium]|nr:VTT domain-containing protein [Betaproteobacteria bacterium]
MDQLEQNTARAAPWVLAPGRNCWRIERAQRLRFLVDGAEYFTAVRKAIARAQRTIFILGWDIDSRMRLMPQGANDGLPEGLCDFINAVVAGRPNVRAYILSWDFAMLFALEREWLPVYKLDWRTHPRLSFRLDANHPVGASHHQKVVVIDDALAFVGGFDLTQRRWDTPEHACDAAARCDANGTPYPPFHDLQAMVDGNVARALGELARTRWHQAVGRPARSLDTAPRNDPWPIECPPDITDVDVAVARTEPAFNGRPGALEIRQLHFDMIAAARRHLYMENQYFSSSAIAHALAQRLREADGPEVVLVSPRWESGWLEETTMGVLRARLHHRLREADPVGRYRMYCPDLPRLTTGCLNLHSKLLVADDELLTIGSANLSNRSMGFDTECNLALEARGEERVRRAIAGLRNRLLGEHLGTEPGRVGAEIMRRSSLVKAIEALRGSGRTLQPIEPIVTADIDALVPDEALIDPERPVDPAKLVADFVPAEATRPAANRMARTAILVLVLAALAAAWRWTPLRDWLDVGLLVGMATMLEEAPFTPLAVVAAYVVAGLMVMPVTVLIAVTGIVFGPIVGALYALAGAVMSAAVTYAVGRHLGRDTVRRLAGARLNRISQRLGQRGLIAIVVVRILPLAPFTIVNIVAGASHIGLRDFILGTVIGMTPGILATVVFVDRILEAVRNPGVGTFVSLAVVASLLVAVVVMLRRRLANLSGGHHRAA